MNPKPKINKLQNPNWGYLITKSVQRVEMKTRTTGSRDVERERERSLEKETSNEALPIRYFCVLV